jgi:predicted nuclease of predicted toxin-antitoxin system
MLKNLGHEVIYHREVLPEKTPDDVVCVTAMANDAILIAIDADLKHMAKRYGVTQKSSRFEKLNLIRLCCDEVLAVKRLEQAMDLINLEWSFRSLKPARRMWVDIGPHFIRTNR